MCLGIAASARSQTPVQQRILANIPIKNHERAMTAAIVAALQNPVYPFGAVMTIAKTGEIVATGVNASSVNPTFHGEIVCMNDYLKKFGNKNWKDLILYTTGESCPMCMSALTWAGIGGVVYGSSIRTISQSGIRQINISSRSVVEAADFSPPDLLGGVLEKECDALFINRHRTEHQA